MVIQQSKLLDLIKSKQQATPHGSGPFPTILHTHGGPAAVTQPVYSPHSQAWLDHGFAFLSLNYHGSTTFGQAFESSIYGKIGELETMDMKLAHEWLINNKIAIPSQIFLLGASYGGFLSLLATGKYPHLWAGCIAEVAVADWKMMYEDQSELLKNYLCLLFGGTPEKVDEQMKLSSPITYAKDIVAPILILQGKTDSRCPARQMEFFVKKLQSLKKEVEIHWFDAGHSVYAKDLNIQHQELMMRFARDILE